MITLSQALAVVSGRKDFAVTRHDGTVTLNYLLRLPDSFDGIRREFRGITFDESTGELLSLPFHKFYNVGETPETQFAELRHLQASIFEKVDGTLIHWMLKPMPVGRRLAAATRMRPGTVQAVLAEEFVDKEPWLRDAIIESVDAGSTPLFEFVDPANPIVVAHDRPRLVYLTSRDRQTGQYHREPRLLAFDHAQEYRFPFADVMKELEGRTDFEGYVCHLENGLVVKAKTQWYLERHRVFDMVLRPVWRIWECVYAGLIDDVVAKAADAYKPALRDVWEQAQQRLLKEMSTVQLAYVDAVRATDAKAEPRVRRKQFVEAARRTPANFAAMMALWDGKGIDGILQKAILDEVRVTHTHRLVEMEGAPAGAA